MSMPIEAFMPCLGTVDACVKNTEENVPPGCCPTGIESSKILTAGADFVSKFDITYSGTLFALISSAENWVVETWLENVGGVADVNLRKSRLIQHVPSATVQTITDKVVFNYTDLVAGDMYKVMCKVELKVGGVLIVCGFYEGDIIHVSES